MDFVHSCPLALTTWERTYGGQACRTRGSSSSQAPPVSDARDSAALLYAKGSDVGGPVTLVEIALISSQGESTSKGI